MIEEWDASGHAPPAESAGVKTEGNGTTRLQGDVRQKHVRHARRLVMDGILTVRCHRRDSPVHTSANYLMAD